MKKIFFLLLLAMLLALPLVACNKTPNTPPDNGQEEITETEITGITFSDANFDFDGQEHAVTVTGIIPDGVSVSYANNKGTDAGTYNATATLSGTGYKTLTLNAKLTINPLTITGVTFRDKRAVYTGKEHTVTVEGSLPEGVSVSYTNNTATKAGTYNATAVLSGKNYATLTLHATLEIYTIQEIAIAAKDVLTAVLSRPDPWEFIPEGLQEKSMAYAALPQYDFTNFTQTSSIKPRAIGKQLNVLYDFLNHTETALAAFDKVYAAGEKIASVYQTFLNTNPANYRQFEGEAAGFKVKIVLTDTVYSLLAGNSAVSVELTSNIETGERYGRIQVTDGFSLKYESNVNHMKLALKGTVAGAGFVSQVEFLRDNEGTVTGYLNEFIGAESAAVKTCAILYADEERTVIMSNKREPDDLPIVGYEEIYDSQTGEMIGGEVQETLKVGTFDTLWFPMNKVTGITSVKAVKKSNAEGEDKNTVNLDYVYVNGSENVLETKKIMLTQTREYDIEMKDVWYIVRETDDNGKIVYRKVKSSVPMLFIQTKYFNNFSNDIVKTNQGKTTFSAAPTADTTVYNELTTRFPTVYETYKTIKETVTFQAVVTYIGTADPFFDKSTQA